MDPDSQKQSNDPAVLKARIAELEERLARAASSRQPFNEATYSAIFDLSPLPVWINFNNRIVYVNPAGAALLKTTREGVIGRPPFDFIHPAHWEAARLRIARILETGESQTLIEEQFVRTDGAVIDVEVAAWRVPWEDGIAIRVSFLDITGKKHTERRLAEAREESLLRSEDFDALFRSIPAAVAISADAECSTIRSNPVMASMLGVPGGENTSKTGPGGERMPFRFCRNGKEILPEELPQQTCGREGRPIDNVDLEVVRDDGRMLYLYGSATPLFDAAGKVRGTIAAYVDVTAHRTAERALQQSEERFRRFVETCTIGVAFTSSFGGVIRYANPALLELLGYTADEVARGHLHWRQISPADQWDRDQSADAELRQRGSVAPYEREFIAKDGRRIPIIVGYSLHQPPDGPETVFLFCVDITERNRMERELRRSNADLTQFAYAVSHDLREPLRMIISFSQLVERRLGPTLDEDSRRCLGFIVEGARRMERALGDLLTYSRFGFEERPGADLDCAGIVNRVLLDLRASIEETKAVVEVGPLPRVQAHEVHLAQLFQNLISNAVKYHQPGSPPHVRIQCVAVGREQRFSVTDDGIGIPPSQHEQIFLLFRRLHHTEEYSGTGIGLALCKRIVESYGGRIWVESEDGQGARFYFTLPAPVSRDLQ